MPVFEKVASWIVIFSIVILGFLMIYGKNGYVDQKELHVQERNIVDEGLAIDMKNRALERKIIRLKGDPDYIEHIARHELGMLAEDELVFRY